jgi:hypothetical protein
VGHIHHIVQILLTRTGDVQDPESSYPEPSLLASKWRVGSGCVQRDRKRHDGTHPSPRPTEDELECENASLVELMEKIEVIRRNEGDVRPFQRNP